MEGLVFSRKNFVLLAISIVLLVVGYILLGQGPVYSFASWKAAPVILVLVYCVLIPWSIIANVKKSDIQPKQTQKSE
jgi:hypothetical protein